MKATPILTEQISRAASEVAGRYRLEPDDLCSEAHCDIWSLTGFPEEDVEKYVCRVAERLSKREKRRRKRFVTITPGTSRGGSSPADQVELADLKATLREVPKTQFEREALDVILGEHPEYEAISELAEWNDSYSRNHSYRIISQFRARLQHRLSSVFVQ